MSEAWSFGEMVAGGVTGLLMLVFMLQRFMTFWKREKVEQANSSAVEAQFKALQQSIEQHTKELEQLRNTVTTMDRTIHKQQRTITRLEMLAIQMKGLLTEAGVSVPQRVQDEIDELIEDRQ